MDPRLCSTDAMVAGACPARHEGDRNMLGLTMPSTRANRRAFSLIELVIVVVIIGIIGAIALPRMSRGASGAADSALIADLAVLRNAIDLYQAEHGGTYPSFSDFVAQMITYTDVNGATSASKDTTHYLGPYLRAVPQLKLGSNKGQAGLTNTLGGAFGWVYDETSGTITANLLDTEVDDRGTQYNDY